MRHSFRLIICLIVVFLWVLMPLLARAEVQYLRLVHQSHFSPNGRHNAVIVEDKYPGGSEFSLILLTMGKDGFTLLNSYCLTPRYDEFVLTPEGNIAFVVFDTSDHYRVQVYNPNKIEFGNPLEYNTDKITQLQFSKDMRAFCYYSNFDAHPWASIQQKIENRLRPKGWLIFSEEEKRYLAFAKSGNAVFSKAEKETYTEWAPIKRPKKLPQLFTQPMPKIVLKTQIQWSPDSNYIYVLDETGIWQLELDAIYFPLWTKVVNSDTITRFQLPRIGTFLLYETIPDTNSKGDDDFLIKLDDFSKGVYDLRDPHKLTRDIWLVDTRAIDEEKKKPTVAEIKAAQGPIWLLDATPILLPIKLTRGWGASFNPISEKVISYSTFEGKHLLNLEKLPTNPDISIDCVLSTQWAYD